MSMATLFSIGSLLYLPSMFVGEAAMPLDNDELQSIKDSCEGQNWRDLIDYEGSPVLYGTEKISAEGRQITVVNTHDKTLLGGGIRKSEVSFDLRDLQTVEPREGRVLLVCAGRKSCIHGADNAAWRRTAVACRDPEVAAQSWNQLIGIAKGS